MDESNRVYALYPLRIGLAAVFLVYGINKFRDLDGTGDMFDAWGIPAAGAAAVLVAIAEVGGGLALFTGILARFSAAVLTIVLLTAIFVVKWDVGFQGGWAFDAALISGLVTVLINGPGRPTLMTACARITAPKGASAASDAS